MNRNILLAILVFYPFLGGILVYLAGKYREICRDYLADFITVSEFLATAALMTVDGAELQVPGICGFGLGFALDGFRGIYGCIASLMWMMVTVFSREYFRNHENKNRFYLFLLWTLGATMGIFYSADLYTTFIFFEIMSFTSYVWVVQEETEDAIRAAQTYLAVAVTGGMAMLMGLFLLYHELGTLVIAELLPASAACADKSLLYVAGTCLLVGFGAKAGAFPLHIWLPKAHPAAPAPASALLSGILTKTGIFGILIISCQLFFGDGVWGKLILAIGVVTMFMGALLALFSVDIKRTLACSSMSQVGFILVGIGMQGLLETEQALAVHGTFLHMVNHSLIKLVLFMAAGVIYMNTHALNLNEIRGFGRNKPLFKGIFLTGALAIAGIPFFSGYISKMLLHESIVEFGGGMPGKMIEILFLISGGLTVAYMTKLYVAVFVEENTDSEKQKSFDETEKFMNRESGFALAASAVILLIWGLFPHSLMDRAATYAQSFMNLQETGERVSYFAPENLLGMVISVGIGAAVYVLIVRKVLMRKMENGTVQYVDLWPKWLDLENLIYRPVVLGILPSAGRILSRILDTILDGIVVLLRKTIYHDSPLPHEREEGNILTEILGKILNAVQTVKNHTVRRKHPVYRDYVHEMAVRNEEFKENNRVIERSLSFGLMLFCIGLTLTLIYLIWW